VIQFATVGIRLEIGAIWAGGRLAPSSRGRVGVHAPSRGTGKNTASASPKECSGPHFLDRKTALS